MAASVLTFPFEKQSETLLRRLREGGGRRVKLIIMEPNVSFTSLQLKNAPNVLIANSKKLKFSLFFYLMLAGSISIK